MMEERKKAVISAASTPVSTSASTSASVSVRCVRISRRAALKTGLMWGAGILGAAVLGVGYSAGIEPRRLEVVRTRLALPQLPGAFRGVKAAHFSDVHFGFHFGLPELRTLVEKIAGLKPDLICFTGDLVEAAVGPRGKQISELLGELKAPLGKFAVLGNHDWYSSGEEVAKVLENGGFRCLRNESVPVFKDGERIRLAGVEDPRGAKPDLQAALKSSLPGEFILLLSHRPDFAVNAARYPVRLQLSGHSHGGQIRLPFHGPAKRVPGAVLYPEGHYKLNGGKLQLYTNRGIGVTGYPIRLFCRPELTLHTFV